MSLSTLVAACSPETQSHELRIGSGGPVVGDTSCRNTTIDGRVFYDDHRRDGRFSLRLSPTGATGAADPAPENAPPTSQNFLALLDAEVNLFEVAVDDAFVFPLGTAVVDSSGSFRWTGTVCDTFEDGSVDIAAKVVLRNCTNPEERCFSVEAPDDHSAGKHYDDEWSSKVYSEWHWAGTQTEPHELSGSYVNLGEHYYGIGATPRPPLALLGFDLRSKAASVFASMVDVTRAAHLESTVPSNIFQFVAVEAIFPNPIGGNGHSHQASRLCVPGTSSLVGGDHYFWPIGMTTMHEYGHLLHYRSWDGVGKWTDTCYDHGQDDECAIDDGGLEHKIQAFKEGWANFVERVALDGSGCEEIEDSPMTTCSGPAFCADQEFIANDVAGILCDLWDPKGGRIDFSWSDEDVYGTEDLGMLVEAVETMWTQASLVDRTDVHEAGENQNDRTSVTLGICEFVDALIEVDPFKRDQILETVRSNKLDCE